MKLRYLALATLVSCGAAWAANAADNAPQTQTPQTPAPAFQPIESGEKSPGIASTSFAPLAYFNANCARCHGENGAAYPDDMGKDKDDDALRKIINEMAKGPGNAPLAPADLEVLTAWHRALRDKKPFIVVVKAEKNAEGWQLSGEVSPDSALKINGETVPVDGTGWKYQTSQNALKLSAQKGETTTELNANAAALAP